MIESKDSGLSMPFFDVQEYLKEQFTREIIHRMRSEPGMEWFAPGTPPPDRLTDPPK